MATQIASLIQSSRLTTSSWLRRHSPSAATETVLTQSLEGLFIGLFCSSASRLPRICFLPSCNESIGLTEGVKNDAIVQCTYASRIGSSAYT